MIKDYNKAMTKNEKASCLDQVDEGCRALCKVIAPKGSEKLLQAYQEARTDVFSNIKSLTALIAAYKQAPTRSSKNPDFKHICTALSVP